jgi:broad specificity phosphatase PhoE/predicted nucleotidyltransferase
MEIEKKLIKDILNTLANNKDILSATIVGSLLEKKIDEISDVDIVVILDTITIKKIKFVKTQLLELIPSNYKTNKIFKVNDTFGPLKFDDEDTLVFHLMIYDTKSHIEHVIQSPFTCLDWERSSLFVKKSLSEIYSVKILMFNDFFNLRRGVDSYLNDLSSNKITFRRLVEDQSGNLTQKEESYSLDEKHLVEYCYHIIKNTITNLLKVVNKHNIRYSDEDILIHWSKNFQENHIKYSELFKKLSVLKNNKRYENNEFISETKNFLSDIYINLKYIYDNSTKITILRHLETPENDGRFLGQNSNPGIKKEPYISENLKKLKYLNNNCYSSPSLRAIETAVKIGLKIENTDSRLNEFNYGKAEGKFFKEFIDDYPDLKLAIEQKMDFKFPDGESYTEINTRVLDLINELSQDTTLISHQGPIRALVGDLLNIPVHLWYDMQIPYGEPIEIIKIDQELYLNLERKLLKKIVRNIK